MKQAELRYYISINVNGQHPLMRSAQGYTEYYSEALEFSDLFDAYRFVERHGLEKLASIITRPSDIYTDQMAAKYHMRRHPVTESRWHRPI